jgi:hypothetical protein
MGCCGSVHDCLRSVGWMKSSAFVVTLVSVYAAALALFVDIAVNDQAKIMFKQPLQHPSSPSADLTKSTDYVGTLKLSAAGVDTTLNQFNFIVSYVPVDRIQNDAGALVQPVRFEVQGQTVLYTNATAGWSIPRRLSSLQGREGTGKLILYATNHIYFIGFS